MQNSSSHPSPSRPPRNILMWKCRWSSTTINDRWINLYDELIFSNRFSILIKSFFFSIHQNSMLNDGLVFLIWKDIFPSLAARWVLNSDQIKCQFPFSGFNGKLRKSLSNKGKLDREISGPKDRTPCTHGSDKDILHLCLGMISRGFCQPTLQSGAFFWFHF